MRPLELSVTGLRSYRTTRTISFPEDWQLAAVVGPTGAGKSSLLEALVYALFGSGTVRGASQPTNLITDDAREMRVVLRFGVGPDEYEIVRTYRRSGANVPPVLRSGSRTITGAREVDDEVARILGLRQDAFCSTVLLPQGQFATLLQAAGNVQKETLDAFFRLSEVTEVSERLVAAANSLASLREQVEVVRRQIPADPAADVEQARHRVEQARAAREAANVLAAKVAAHERGADEARSRAFAARERAGALAEAAAKLDQVAARAGALATLTTEIAADESTLNERKRQAFGAVREGREALECLDAPAVEAAAAHIAALHERLEDAMTATVDAETAAELARQTELALERIRAEHGALVEQRDAAIAAYEAADTARADAIASVDYLDTLAKEADRCSEAADKATKRHAAAASDLQHARDAEDQAQRELVKAHETLARVETESARAAGELEDAEAAEEATVQRADEVQRLRGARDHHRAEHDRCAEALASCGRALTEATTDLAGATRLQNDAEALWARAHVAAARARRHDAAAVAGAECHPGEPCPVCARELPRDFVPPAPSATTAALEAEETAAREAFDACRESTARARAAVETCTKEQARASAQHGEAEAALGQAERLLAAAGGAEADRLVHAVELAGERRLSAARAERAASDAVVECRSGATALERTLGPLAGARERVAAALNIAESERDDAVERSSAARDSFVGAGGDVALVTARAALDESTRTASERKLAADSAKRAAKNADARLAGAERNAAAAIATAESTAAQQHRADEAVGAALANVPAEARDAIITDAARAAAQADEWVRDRRALIDKAQEGQRAAEAALAQVEGALNALSTRRAREIDEPASGLRDAAGRLSVLADLPAPAAAANSAGLAAWAVAAATTARERSSVQTGVAEAADADVASAIDSVEAACAAAGIARDDLDRRRADAEAEVGGASEAFRRATEIADRARALDAALSASATRARVLTLARELCQGRESFVSHVLVARRQGLIAEAAAILSELSSGRLTFADDVAATFTVLDTATGSMRDPRLLSGGEQFQASLALALGLVEIAARAGSRIECLFLDEGFGALDPASLDTALDALESAARRGRRIVAVTHVEPVTARADQVLSVSGSDAGSRAVWRGAVLEPLA
jgi:exonuclease SbcC